MYNIFIPYNESFSLVHISIYDRKTVFSLNTFSLINKRYFSSFAGTYKPSSARIYVNADTQKLSILSDNKGKAGVYLWINNINGKKYVGSSIRLGIRLTQYFNVNYLKRTLSMPICQSLLKHGYSNFSLEILEYCNSSECIEKETYYIQILKPEYNIQLFPARPSVGVKLASLALNI